MAVDGLHHPGREVHVDTLGLDSRPSRLLQIELIRDLLARIELPIEFRRFSQVSTVRLWRRYDVIKSFRLRRRVDPGEDAARAAAKRLDYVVASPEANGGHLRK